MTLPIRHDALFFFLDDCVQLSDILLLFLSFFQRQLGKPSDFADHLLDLIEMDLVLVCKVNRTRLDNRDVKRKE